MGCFSTCFNTCKPSRRRRRRSLKTHPSLLDHLENYQSIDDFQVPQLIQEEEGEEGEEEEIEEHEKGEEKAENTIDISPDRKVSNDEKKEKANSSGKKKVTFDLNVKFYENLSREEEEDEINEEERFSDEIGKTQVKAKSGFHCECSSDSNSSSLFSYPLNHRYQNIRDSDDEFDETLSSDDSDIDDYTDDDNDGHDGDEVESGIKDEKLVFDEEQSSESLFSVSIDSKKHKLSSLGCEKEVNSPMPTKNAPLGDLNSGYDRTKYVDSVLNPVENLTQWKEIKSRSRFASKDQPKENVNSVQDFNFPVLKESLEDQKEVAVDTRFVPKDQPKENINYVQDFNFPVKKEIAVDTSLSTWLVGSDKGKPERTNSRNSSVSVGNSQSDSRKVSPNKFEDRPILGALTLEEIRQISANITPRKLPSRSRSPDEMPIIGSVGSYWSHTGQGTNSGGSSAKSTKSRYRESAEVIWDSTPFEARLEKALETEANAEEVFAV